MKNSHIIIISAALSVIVVVALLFGFSHAPLTTLLVVVVPFLSFLITLPIYQVLAFIFTDKDSFL